MGTNYYLYEKPDCKCCGRPFEPRHIGKSSWGWCFSLHVMPEDGINTLEDWKARWNKPDAHILDEYGKPISVEIMEEIITKRSAVKHTHMARKWREMNHATPGPNNLARSTIDGQFCIGHGSGTWDYKIGDFS